MLKDVGSIPTTSTAHPAGAPSRRARRRTGLAALAAYVLTIVAANWAIKRFGLVPVGFGYRAPAGVWFAGLAFTLRDLTHANLGPRWALAAIVGGAALSVGISPRFALASGAAFLLSELADFAVYTPLAERGWLAAVAASNVVGLVVDSCLFLWLAFGSVALVPGQVIGKGWMTLLALVVLVPLRRVVVAPAYVRARPAA